MPMNLNETRDALMVRHQSQSRAISALNDLIERNADYKAAVLTTKKAAIEADLDISGDADLKGFTTKVAPVPEVVPE